MNPLKAHHIAIVFAVMLFCTCPAFAATSARLHVSATVFPFVSFNAAQHIATYQVNSEDLRRGYVDLPNAITVSFRTNISGGVPVFVDNWGGGRILIRESGTGSYQESSFTLNTAGSRPNSFISKKFDSRIILPADAREGVYSLNISMTPAI